MKKTGDMTLFPELSLEDNMKIRQARDLGWAVFYPCVPTAQAQAENTLRGALQFLASKGITTSEDQK